WRSWFAYSFMQASSSVFVTKNRSEVSTLWGRPLEGNLFASRQRTAIPTITAEHWLARTSSARMSISEPCDSPSQKRGGGETNGVSLFHRCD
ncbi:MAG: hypothetical protein FWD61_09370, partial [Phycisphaerales bacterium]|nr:hypothetical protein [Phycisphaerales bacterium]